MGFLRMRQFILGFFLAIALLFVFEAGEKGVEPNRHFPSKTYQKPFKSFPLFAPQGSVPGDIQTKSTEGQVKFTEENQKKEESLPQEKEEEENKKDMRNPDPHFRGDDIHGEQKTSPKESPLGTSRTDSFGVIIPTDKAIDPDLASLRKKTLPQISELYVPVYSDQNLTSDILSDFYAHFTKDSPEGKLYVLGSEASSSNGDSYEILVYENQGAQLKGTFTTTASSQFPFQGLPIFEPRQPARFEQSMRLLVFAQSQADLHQLLSQEAHVQAILKSAYHPNPDPQTFVGTDFEWNVDVYHVFPGIFLAETLR